MNNTKYLLLLLCLGLFAGDALAQEIVVPDREKLRGMSYEEYSSIREKMRHRLENRKESADENDQAGKEDTQPAAQGSYGKSYKSRSQQKDSMDTGLRPERPERLERPERPHVDRFERPDIMRR
jgi:hypothetical protein